jgi:hypothetical protein
MAVNIKYLGTIFQMCHIDKNCCDRTTLRASHVL